MAERIQTTYGNDDDDHHQQWQMTPANTGSSMYPVYDQNTNNPVMQLAVPDRNQNTYVVHFPKDQIYRVPPPENSKIVESYQNPEKEETSTCRIVYWVVFGSLVALVVLGFIAILIVHLAVKPEPSTFTIARIATIKKYQYPVYNMTLSAKVPNGYLNTYYSNRGNGVMLLFNRKKIASGTFPDTTQKSDVARINMHVMGSKIKLPALVDKSLNDEEDNHQVTLQLAMDVTLKIDLWNINLWTKDMDVRCDFKVDKLREDTRILSQRCVSKIK